MKTSFRKSFVRDLKKIKDDELLAQVKKAIVQVEEAKELKEVGQVKKIVGTSNYFRIKIADHRIGLVVEGEAVEFVRCLHRRDMYRYFP
jgi:mRNA interferase RelE/StbE